MDRCAPPLPWCSGRLRETRSKSLAGVGGEEDNVYLGAEGKEFSFDDVDSRVYFCDGAFLKVWLGVLPPEGGFFFGGGVWGGVQRELGFRERARLGATQPVNHRDSIVPPAA